MSIFYVNIVHTLNSIAISSIFISAIAIDDGGSVLFVGDGLDIVSTPSIGLSTVDFVGSGVPFKSLDGDESLI